MIRGKKVFRCPKCGKIFWALDVEYNATTFSQPMPCPDCKTLSAPLFKSTLYGKLGIIRKEEK